MAALLATGKCPPATRILNKHHQYLRYRRHSNNNKITLEDKVKFPQKCAFIRLHW